MKTISRRNFLKGTATGLVAAGILGTQAYAEQADGSVKVTYEKSIPWHTQYKAINALPARIIEAQSVEVDMVTGATSTSRGLLEAVADALSKVGK